MLARARGYRCMLVMPVDMSTARPAILRAYGADLALTPAHDGMRGAVDEAERIVQRSNNSGTAPALRGGAPMNAWMPRQFDNPSNPRVHERTTATELWEATGGAIDAFVAGVGTGGTITGVARGLRARGASVRVYAVEPKTSAVLSGGSPGLHGIQGLGAGFIPKVLDRSQIDEVIAVSDLDAERMTGRLARELGLYVGPSSGANVHAAVRVASRMRPDQRVVTILCDTGERYQS
jgi:cysteine synthase A